MREHVEQKDGEIFVGNTKADGSSRVNLDGLRTARMGNQAYDIHGKKISPDYMRPLFIGCTEIHRYHKRMNDAFNRAKRDYMPRAAV